MPRDLSDVLHYFLPEAEEPSAEAQAGGMCSRSPTMRTREALGSNLAPRRAPSPRMPLLPLPIVSVPMGERDVVRAAFTWNLAVEIARLGGCGAVVAPTLDEPSPLWPEPGVGPLGAELVLVSASGGAEALYRSAVDVAVSRAEGAKRGGLVLVRFPPDWLCVDANGAALLRWVLCFSTADPRDLLRTRDLACRIARQQPAAKLGVSVHGAARSEEASRAFDELARETRGSFQHDLENYGVLVDDLDVYRAIVARRPIGLAHPQSPAARALRELAQRLLAEGRPTDLT